MNPRMTFVCGASALLAGALAASPASAAILSVSGQTTLLGSAPADCTVGQLTGFNAFAWNEQTNQSFAALNVDMVNNPGNSSGPIPGVLSGIFDSHFLHFEGLPGVIGAGGTVTYSAPIRAVIFRNVNLNSTDATLGSVTTIYPTGFPFRSIAGTNSFFSINANVLTFDLKSISSVQRVIQLRVLTDAPTPGAASLGAIGGLVCLRRRRAG